jgi:hypothetical protein
LSACLALGLAVFSVYFPALSNEFLMQWDDHWVESAAWLSASKIPLYSFFFLLALISYVGYVRGRQLKYYFLSLLFVLSFGGKEQAVSLSLTLVLFDYVLGRNMKDRNIWFEKIPFFVFTILGGMITVYSAG